MESKWLKEALFAGMTSNAFKLGTTLSLGWFWMRVAGCHTVYRGQDGVMNYDNICAVMNVDAAQVTVGCQNLPAGTIWEYIRRQVSPCGLESGDSDSCRVIIDANGDAILNAPNAPDDVTIEIVAGGMLKLRWRYRPLWQVVEPTGFYIFMDSGSGFDFETPVATVPFMRSVNNEFNWTSDALEHGQLYKFVVRSYRQGEGQSQNTGYVAARADSQGPAAITGLRASWQEL